MPAPTPSAQDGQTHQFRLTNRADEIGRFSQWINDLIPQYGFSDKLLFQADLVLTETITNIIDHAFPDSQTHDISVALRCETPSLFIKIIDQGVPFNPLEDHQVHVSDTLDEAGLGGLGIHLIKSYAHDCAYVRENDSNIFSLRLEDDS